MTDRNFIHYYAESVTEGRSILRRDVVIDGEMVPELSHALGSPAPTEVVEQHERTVKL